MEEENTNFDNKEFYKEFISRKKIFILILGTLLGGIAVISLTAGSSSVGLRETIHAILFRIFPNHFNSSQVAQVVVWKLRLPRILMGIAAGAGLASAGTALQGTLRNPLASPYTLGIASGAAFGAAFAIVLEPASVYESEIYLAGSAFLFSLFPAFIVFALGKFKEAEPQTLIFAGIAMMYLFSASTSFLQYIGTEQQVVAVVYWMFGSLSKSNWSELLPVSLITFAALSVFSKWAWDFNALSSGDEVAKSLGVNAKRVRLGGIILASLATSIAVAFLGTIGFIGLVAPHITRILIGKDHRFLFPAACLMGSIIMISADTVSRIIIYPQVLPVGILTSFLGVPLFMYLIIRGGRVY